MPARRGIGHVYSSAHVSHDEAEQQLAGAHPEAQRRPAVSSVPHAVSRSIPGYRERFWHRNCVAVGLSAGFVEPLEASALALVEPLSAA